MAIPQYVQQLRQHIGTDLLWLPGVSAVITTAQRDRVLLVKRADNLQWTTVTGIVDPGDDPADAAVRETMEEAGVSVEPLRLISVDVVGPVTYENGDVSQYVDIAFHMEYRAGDPYPADGENVAAQWFSPDQLPPMNPRFERLVALCLQPAKPAQFVSNGVRHHS